jgi:hypothetical protein
MRAAIKRDFPVNILCWGNVDAGTALIDRHPDTRFIIDHLAILQPRTPPAPPQPWADLPKVICDGFGERWSKPPFLSFWRASMWCCN